MTPGGHSGGGSASLRDIDLPLAVHREDLGRALSRPGSDVLVGEPQYDPAERGEGGVAAEVTPACDRIGVGGGAVELTGQRDLRPRSVEFHRSVRKQDRVLLDWARQPGSRQERAQSDDLAMTPCSVPDMSEELEERRSTCQTGNRRELGLELMHHDPAFPDGPENGDACEVVHGTRCTRSVPEVPGVDQGASCVARGEPAGDRDRHGSTRASCGSDGRGDGGVQPRQLPVDDAVDAEGTHVAEQPAGVTSPRRTPAG